MIRRLVLTTFALVAPFAQAAEVQGRIETRPSQLVPGFLNAIEQVATGAFTLVNEPNVQVWVDGLKARGVDPQFLAARLEKARQQASLVGVDFTAPFNTVEVELFDETTTRREATFATALHAFRLDILDELDDWANDDVYAYFITTHDDLLWWRVTSIYSGLDRGDSVFLSAEDRGIFGPQGEKLVAKNHTIVDFGLVESDGDDIKELQKLSDTIVDLALVALTVSNPTAGAAAAQARAEVKNLLHLVIAMDNDDRIVADTLRFTPETLESQFGDDSVTEFSRVYEGQRGWSSYSWRMNFRLIK